MANEPRESEVRALFDAVEDRLAVELAELPHPEKPDQKIWVADVPKGRELESLKELIDQYRTRPERRSGSASFTSLQSFIDHAKRFMDKGSAIFANDDPKQPSLTSVLDYHEPTGAGGARFGHHRGFYPFPVSEEWTAWTKLSGSELSQTQFAQLIEDRLIDIVVPDYTATSVKEFADKLNVALADPGQMLSLSRGLTVYKDSRTVDHVNLQSGEGRVSYEVTHKSADGGVLNVPYGFVLGIPVFRGYKPYFVPARLRYRPKDGKIFWTFDLFRVDRVFRAQVTEACKLATTETGLPLYYGRPEDS